MKKTILSIAIALAIVATIPLTASAATEAQKLAAINLGLANLASTQSVGGYWNTYTGYAPAETGSAVLAFLEQGNTETTGLYKAQVKSGLNYLFNSATKDASGHIYWSGEDTYQTGLALSAIAATKTPNTIVSGGALNGMTYKQVTLGVVKYFADGQNTAANHWQGSWGYSAKYGSGDNSTTQWPVVGMLFASSKMGVAVPASVITNLNAWTGGIQNLNGTPATNPAYGSSGYDNSTTYNDVSKTGGLLLELYAEGKTASDPQVQAALGFINRNWVSGGNFAGAPWDGNFGQPYAMWSVYKGLQATIGLDNKSWITSLNAPATTDSGRGWNWYEDYSNWLVNNQLPDGSWAGYSYWGGALATSWDINMLQATTITPVPEPGEWAMMLGGLSLMGFLSLRRAKTEKAA